MRDLEVASQKNEEVSKLIGVNDTQRLEKYA